MNIYGQVNWRAVSAVNPVSVTITDADVLAFIVLPHFKNAWPFLLASLTSRQLSKPVIPSIFSF